MGMIDLKKFVLTSTHIELASKLEERPIFLLHVSLSFVSFDPDSWAASVA
jgi:hypothetical protein